MASPLEGGSVAPALQMGVAQILDMTPLFSRIWLTSVKHSLTLGLRSDIRYKPGQEQGGHNYV
jgi:hypothetical protein